MEKGSFSYHLSYTFIYTQGDNEIMGQAWSSDTANQTYIEKWGIKPSNDQAVFPISSFILVCSLISRKMFQIT